MLERLARLIWPLARVCQHALNSPLKRDQNVQMRVVSRVLVAIGDLRQTATGLGFTAIILSALCASAVAEATAPMTVKAPVLSLAAVQDADVSAALRSSYNLPARIEAARGVSDLTAGELAEWIEIERRRLRELMVSFGYLDAKIDIDGDVANGGATFLPEPGSRYRIGTIALAGIQNAEIGDPSGVAYVLSNYVGQLATHDVFGRLENDIVYIIGSKTYALARVADREVATDPNIRLAKVILNIDTGPAALFGSVEFYGTNRSARDDLAQLVPFEPGDPFERFKLDLLRTRLDETGAFSRVRLDVARELDAGGRLAVSVHLTEKPTDVALLTRAGGIGVTTAALAMFVVGLGAVASVAGGSPKLVRSMAVLSWILVPAFLIVALLRIVSFLPAA